MSRARRFHSCYVTDVKTEGNTAQISDSARGVWSIDLADHELLLQFKTWLEKVFLKGVPQTLTVFEYEDGGTEETGFDFWIKKFCNLPSSSS